MLELTMPFQDYKIVSFSSIWEAECFYKILWWLCFVEDIFFFILKTFKTQSVLHRVNKLELFCK